MYQEDWDQKSWKKSPSRPFLAHPAGGQETTFYLKVALALVPSIGEQTPASRI